MAVTTQTELSSSFNESATMAILQDAIELSKKNQLHTDNNNIDVTKTVTSDDDAHYTDATHDNNLAILQYFFPVQFASSDLGPPRICSFNVIQPLHNTNTNIKTDSREQPLHNTNANIRTDSLSLSCGSRGASRPPVVEDRLIKYDAFTDLYYSTTIEPASTYPRWGSPILLALCIHKCRALTCVAIWLIFLVVEVSGGMSDSFIGLHSSASAWYADRDYILNDDAIEQTDLSIRPIGDLRNIGYVSAIPRMSYDSEDLNDGAHFNITAYDQLSNSKDEQRFESETLLHIQYSALDVARPAASPRYRGGAGVSTDSRTIFVVGDATEYVRVSNAGNGSCLFRSLAAGLFGDDFFHSQLSEMVREGLLRHVSAEDVLRAEPLIETLNASTSTNIVHSTVKEYVDALGRETIWGGELEVTVISKMFEVSVEVHTDRFSRVYGEDYRGRRIHLYLENGHYEYMMPPSDVLKDNDMPDDIAVEQIPDTANDNERDLLLRNPSETACVSMKQRAYWRSLVSRFLRPHLKHDIFPNLREISDDQKDFLERCMADISVYPARKKLWSTKKAYYFYAAAANAGYIHRGSDVPYIVTDAQIESLKRDVDKDFLRRVRFREGCSAAQRKWFDDLMLKIEKGSVEDRSASDWGKVMSSLEETPLPPSKLLEKAHDTLATKGSSKVARDDYKNLTATKAVDNIVERCFNPETPLPFDPESLFPEFDFKYAEINYPERPAKRSWKVIKASELLKISQNPGDDALNYHSFWIPVDTSSKQYSAIMVDIDEKLTLDAKRIIFEHKPRAIVRTSEELYNVWYVVKTFDAETSRHDIYFKLKDYADKGALRRDQVGRLPGSKNPKLNIKLREVELVFGCAGNTSSVTAATGQTEKMAASSQITDTKQSDLFLNPSPINNCSDEVGICIESSQSDKCVDDVPLESRSNESSLENPSDSLTDSSLSQNADPTLTGSKKKKIQRNPMVLSEKTICSLLRKEEVPLNYREKLWWSERSKQWRLLQGPEGELLQVNPALAAPLFGKCSINAWLIYVHDEKQQEKICRQLHLASHSGRNQLEIDIQKRYIWFNIRRKVQEAIASCPSCQPKTAKAILNDNYQSAFIQNKIERPWFRVAVDLGTLQEAVDFEGVTRKNILVLVDIFSGYFVCIPLRDKSKDQVMLHLLRIFSLFGFPTELLSDNGGEFAYKNEFERCGVKVLKTTPHNPAANGCAERMVGRVNNLLKRLELDHPHLKWPDLAAQAMLAINSATAHNKTNRMPTELIFRYPHRSLRGQLQDDITSQLFKDAKECQVKASEKAKTSFLRKLKNPGPTPEKGHNLKVGDLVLRRIRGKNNTYQWDGPLAIVDTTRFGFRLKKLASDVSASNRTFFSVRGHVKRFISLPKSVETIQPLLLPGPTHDSKTDAESESVVPLLDFISTNRPGHDTVLGNTKDQVSKRARKATPASVKPSKRMKQDQTLADVFQWGFSDQSVTIPPVEFYPDVRQKQSRVFGLVVSAKVVAYRYQLILFPNTKISMPSPSMHCRERIRFSLANQKCLYVFLDDCRYNVNGLGSSSGANAVFVLYDVSSKSSNTSSDAPTPPSRAYMLSDEQTKLRSSEE